MTIYIAPGGSNVTDGRTRDLWNTIFSRKIPNRARWDEILPTVRAAAPGWRKVLQPLRGEVLRR